MDNGIPLEKRQARGKLYFMLRELSGLTRQDIEKSLDINVMALAAFEHGRPGSVGTHTAERLFKKLTTAALKNITEHPELLDSERRKELLELARQSALPLHDIESLPRYKPGPKPLPGQSYGEQSDAVREAIVKLADSEGVSHQKVSINSGLPKWGIKMFLKKKRPLTAEEAIRVAQFFNCDSAEALIEKAASITPDSYVQAPRVIKMLRTDKGVTADKISEAIGVKKTKYYRFERGDATLRSHELDTAALFLGYPSYEKAVQAVNVDSLAADTSGWAQKSKNTGRAPKTNGWGSALKDEEKSTEPQL